MVIAYCARLCQILIRRCWFIDMCLPDNLQTLMDVIFLSHLQYLRKSRENVQAESPIRHSNHNRGHECRCKTVTACSSSCCKCDNSQEQKSFSAHTVQTTFNSSGMNTSTRKLIMWNESISFNEHLLAVFLVLYEYLQHIMRHSTLCSANLWTKAAFIAGQLL